MDWIVSVIAQSAAIAAASTIAVDDDGYDSDEEIIVCVAGDEYSACRFA